MDFKQWNNDVPILSIETSDEQVSVIRQNPDLVISDVADFEDFCVGL